MKELILQLNPVSLPTPRRAEMVSLRMADQSLFDQVVPVNECPFGCLQAKVYGWLSAHSRAKVYCKAM